MNGRFGVHFFWFVADVRKSSHRCREPKEPVILREVAGSTPAKVSDALGGVDSATALRSAQNDSCYAIRDDPFLEPRCPFAVISRIYAQGQRGAAP
jgi:hypothetical protein